MPKPNAANHHLPPHIREICAILAAGLVRLRSRSVEQAARAASGEALFRLHTVPTQRRCADPDNTETA